MSAKPRLRAALLALAVLAGTGAVLLRPVPAVAIDANEALPDPAQEARARSLFRQLRCLVCQNESIDDSEAGLAHDLRMIVREHIKAGDSDQEILHFLTARYGDFVLLKPPVEPRTWPLWFGPFALLALAGVGLFFVARRRRKMADTPRPLTDEERARLETLLDGKDGAP